MWNSEGVNSGRVRDVRKVVLLLAGMKCLNYSYDPQRKTYGKLVIYLGGKHNINGVSVTCFREDGLEGTEKTIDENGFKGSIICPNIDIICGSSTKPFHCLNGSYSDIQECICNAGWTG